MNTVLIDPRVRAPALPAFITPDTETGRLARDIDWSHTALGPPESWSPTLRMMVPFILANRFPLLLWWGPEYVCFYNDGYVPILGAKHPSAMGKPVNEVWTEVWEVLKPLIDTPFRGGPATWIEDFELDLQRHGYLEETHFLVAYSPVPDEAAPRGIGGVLASVSEITEQVIGERRVSIVSELGRRLAGAQDDVDVCVTAASILSGQPKEIPFALLYLLDADGHTLRLVSRTGIDTEFAGPAVIDIRDDAAAVRWPVAEALRSEQSQVLKGLTGLTTLALGPAPRAIDTVVAVPIKSNIANQPAGALVAGVSPRIRLDQLYCAFLDLVGSQIATALANKRAYEEEKRRAAALAELDRAKTTFFSNVSHEFRTPLTLMLAPLEATLADPALPQALRTPLDVAQRNSLRLLRLVNSLLDFARIEAGRVQASYEPVNLQALTQDLASNFRSAMEKAGLQYEVDCAQLPAPVHVDREMWEKVVLNLLSNAFKFTLQGKVSLRLEDGGDAAVLEVSDTGVGVPEHEVPRLFERFHRVEGTAARTHEGSGIGLALVQELIKLHGGSIEAASEPGKGTRFTIRIPYGSAHLPAARAPAAIPRSTAIGSQVFVEEALRWLPDATARMPGINVDPAQLRAGGDQRYSTTHGARVVLADDNADMRSYVRNLLGDAYRVEAVSNGMEALAAARRERPDMIVTDIMMPLLDGLGLLQQLRADPALHEIPVVLLSARAGEESRIEGLNAGADDYVVKPFSGRELLARVGSLLELTHARREALVAQQKLLEASARQKDEFLAMLAHELRNPLAPIRNSGELLLRSMPEDAPLRSTVHTIERQVTHLTRIVDDLLDVSRITQGRIELRPRPVTVTELVARALETVDPLIRHKKHKVWVNTSRSHLSVSVDPERLVQCLANVITNAAKYTEAGGEIRVETLVEGGKVLLKVSDNGVGIASDLLPKVFDLFVQGERTLDRSQGGLGIGLSLVKRLVEMHDGSVSIDSPGPDLGTVVEIRLPLIMGAVVHPPAADEVESRKWRILVVDDNEDAAQTLAMILELEGHVVAIANSGAEALQRIDEFNPGVVLLDIGLPGLDGYQVAQSIRTQQRHADIRLIALTGYGTEADRARALAAGFARHLVKPVDFGDLTRTLHSL